MAYGVGHACGFGFFGFLGAILFIILLVWAVRYFAGNVRGGSGPFGRNEDTALKTARERLARGEITTEEFETIKKGLAG